MNENSEVTDGIRLALPFAAADVAEGAVYGLVASAAGLGVALPAVASLAVFSGSAQFAALTVSSGGGGLAAVLVAVAAANARYIAYGASIAPTLSPGRARRAAEAHLLTDASWLLATRWRPPRREILVGAGLASLTAWSVGTVVGAAAGAAVGDAYRTLGLDAAVPAFFLCLLLERLRGRRSASAALAGAAVAVLLLPALPPGLPVVGGLAVGLAVG